MLDALQTAAFDAIGGTVAATMRDQVIELIEQHIRYGGARNVARMLQGGRLVDSSGQTWGISYLAIRVHLAGLR